jgi:hypothetical protein
MTPQELLTPELVKALGDYIPSPQRQQPTRKVVVSEGNSKLLKINKT